MNVLTITIDTSTGVVTLPDIGVYKVDFGVLPTSGATATDYVSLFLEGAEVPGTTRDLINGTLSVGSAIIQTTTENSTLNIQIVSAGPIDFASANGTNGYLTIVQIA